MSTIDVISNCTLKGTPTSMCLFALDELEPYYFKQVNILHAGLHY